MALTGCLLSYSLMICGAFLYEVVTVEAAPFDSFDQWNLMNEEGRNIND